MCFSDTETGRRWRHSHFTFQIKVKSIKLPKPIFIWRKYSCAAVILISREYRMMERKQSRAYGKAEKDDKTAYPFTQRFLPSATTLQCRAATWKQQYAGGLLLCLNKCKHYATHVLFPIFLLGIEIIMHFLRHKSIWN